MLKQTKSNENASRPDDPAYAVDHQTEKVGPVSRRDPGGRWARRVAPRSSRLWLPALVALGGSALFALPASAWSAMRCGNRLIDLGDSLYEVRATCGEPDQLDHFVEFRTVRYRVRRTCTRDQGGQEVCEDVFAERTVEVPIHRALYDFGSNRFIQLLTFEAGRLIGIETTGYGKKSPGSS